MSSRLRKLRLAFFVALRIVRSRRSPTLSLVTLISIIGIACGVMALSVVLSVTAGFEATFQDKILGLYPHLVVTSESTRFDNYVPVLEKIRATPGVAGATPITTDSMMVANGVFRAGATIEGVEPETVGDAIRIGGLLKAGRLEDLSETPTPTRTGDHVTVSGLVAGTWQSLLLADGAPPRILTDDRVVPDAGHARIKVLDTRRDRRFPVTLAPRGGAAVDLFKVTDAFSFPTADAASYSTERELPAGDWELAPTGERLLLDADTLVTILILDRGEAPPESRLMVEPAGENPTAGAAAERLAHLRVLDARTTGGPLTVDAAPARPKDAPVPVATVAPGQFSDFVATPARLPGILLGKALADRLRAKVDTDLTLVTPLRGIDNKMMGPFGMLPSSSHFRVVGIFEAGFHDHDSKLAIINLRVGQRFLNRGPLIHSIAVRTQDLLTLQATKAAVGRAIDPFSLRELIENTESLRQKLGVLVQPGFSSRRMTAPDTFVGGLRNLSEAVNLLKFQKSDFARRARYRIYDWEEKNKFMFGALKLQKVVLTMFFLIIILVGSFVVVGSQIMVIHEKTAEIAILKAMGATDNVVRLVFTLQGVLVAFAGALAGLVTGLGLIGLIQAVDYKLEASIYLIDHLPARVDPLEIFLVVLGSLATTLITTQVSASRAANKTVVAGLRAVD